MIGKKIQILAITFFYLFDSNHLLRNPNELEKTLESEKKKKRKRERKKKKKRKNIDILDYKQMND